MELPSNYNRITTKAFTLIEVLIYTALTAVVGMLMTGILLSVSQVHQRESASTEVTGQLNFITQTIGRLVRTASNIEITAGVSTSTLKLRMQDSTKDPTCISLVSGTIKLAEGPGTNPNDCSATTSDLTNSRVVVNALNFKKFVQYPGHDTVSYDVQMTYNSQNPKAQVQRSLSSAIARVSAATFDSSLLPGNTTYEIGQSGSAWSKAYLGDGTTGGPSYTFGNDTTLGIFKVAGTSTIGFSTQGLERMRISASGNVGIGTDNPSASALLDIYSTAKGFLPPRMTTAQRDAVASPSTGLFIYNSTTNALNVYSSSSWGAVGGSLWTASSTAIYYNAGNVGIGTSIPAQKLSVAGTIESTTGGIKFPDGSSQINVVGLRDSYRNLVIKNNTTNPNYQMNISVDEVILQDTSENPFRIANLSVTADITASGANGLDTGSEAASTWYHIWAIAKSDGTKATLLSTSATSPTMPSGYTFKAYLGAVYNNSSSNFYVLFQMNNKVAVNQVNVLSDLSSASFASISLAAAVPSTAKAIMGYITTNEGADVRIVVSPNNSGNEIGSQMFWSLVNNRIQGGYNIYIITAQTIYYRTAGGSGSIYVTGWEY